MSYSPATALPPSSTFTLPMYISVGNSAPSFTRPAFRCTGSPASLPASVPTHAPSLPLSVSPISMPTRLYASSPRSLSSPVSPVYPRPSRITNSGAYSSSVAHSASCCAIGSADSTSGSSPSVALPVEPPSPATNRPLSLPFWPSTSFLALPVFLSSSAVIFVLLATP